jgi:glycosyltransferase involved in cell wall biosynthesis
MTSFPIFSVLVPTYNQSQFLGAALDTLLSQTYDNWEAIVVNDGSTDCTPQVLELYAAKDSRLRVFHQENGGVGAALNTALKAAKGNWICWLSSDDLFINNKLEIHRDWISDYPNCKFFFSRFKILNNEKGNINEIINIEIPQQKIQVLDLLRVNYIAGNSICIERDSWQKIGLFNESLRYAQDYDMWLRLMSVYPATFIPISTYIQRIHPAQDSNKFLEACLYDSAKSIIDFLEVNKFESLFPLVNFNKISLVNEVIDNALSLASDQTAHIYQIGAHPLLLFRIVEFIYNIPTIDDRERLLHLVKRYADKTIKKHQNTLLAFWWAYINNAICNHNFLYYQHISFLQVAKIQYYWLCSLDFKQSTSVKYYLNRFHDYDLNINADSKFNSSVELLRNEIEQALKILTHQDVATVLTNIEYGMKLKELNLFEKLLVADRIDLSLRQINEIIINYQISCESHKHKTILFRYLILFWILSVRFIRLSQNGNIIQRIFGYFKYVLHT